MTECTEYVKEGAWGLLQGGPKTQLRGSPVTGCVPMEDRRISGS